MVTLVCEFWLLGAADGDDGVGLFLLVFWFLRVYVEDGIKFVHLGTW